MSALQLAQGPLALDPARRGRAQGLTAIRGGWPRLHSAAEPAASRPAAREQHSDSGHPERDRLTMDPDFEELESGGMDEETFRRLIEAMSEHGAPGFDGAPSEPAEDAMPAGASDALADAAEALFEGDTEAAIAHARRAVELAPSAPRAHSTLVQALQCRPDWEATLDAACDWAAACGPSAGQLSALLRSAYRVGSKSLVLQALDGMCKVEVEDDEFAMAQACAADMAASAQVGREPSGTDGADTGAPASAACGSAHGADVPAAKPGSAAVASGAGGAGVRPVPPRLPVREADAAAAAGATAGPGALPTPGAAFGAWCVRCDQGRAAGAALLGRLAAAAVGAATSGEVTSVAAASSAQLAWKREYGEEGALATLSVCLGLLAAEAAAGGGRDELRKAWAAAEAAGLVDSAGARAEEGEGVSRLGRQPDANAHCAHAVLTGRRMTADSAAACEERADMIVWRHCGPACRPADL